MTQYADLFAALMAPFEAHEVKTRSQGGKQLHYITARVAMNRLDNVLGPENWWDEYIPHENSVVCKLTIRLPDGSTLTKCDAGGYAGMTDQGDDDKSGYSDSFKRACVKFGVARYLYRDGVPHFAPVPAQVGRPPANGPTKPTKPAAVPWNKFVSDILRRFGDDWNNELAIEDVDPEVRKAHSELTNVHRLTNHLATRLVELGRFTESQLAKEGKPDARDPDKARAAVVATYAKAPTSIEKAVFKYLQSKRLEARIALGLDEAPREDDGVASGKGES